MTAQQQHGFTIIELIIVVVILGLLAASALPRFTDVTADAEDSAIEGVAGGFASAVGIVRGEWELAGRPTGTNAQGAGARVELDSLPIYVDGNTGYPVTALNDTSVDDTLIDDEDCASLMSGILQGSPTVTTDPAAMNDNRYYTYAVDNPDASNNNKLCVYYLTNTIKNITPAPSGDDYQTTGNNFVYNARNGGVTVFSNNRN